MRTLVSIHPSLLKPVGSQFVEACWKHLGPCSRETLCMLSEPIEWSALGCECLAGDDEAPAPEAPVEPEPDPERVRQVDLALKRLHSNLGHPSARELTRVLKHSNASSLALQRVSHLACPVCANHQRFAAPLPANTSRVSEFNQRVGLDVKYLPGWTPGQKIPCVNLVDYASSLQVVVPI